jgi:hypothetical protein
VTLAQMVEDTLQTDLTVISSLELRQLDLVLRLHTKRVRDHISDRIAKRFERTTDSKERVEGRLYIQSNVWFSEFTRERALHINKNNPEFLKLLVNWDAIYSSLIYELKGYPGCRIGFDRRGARALIYLGCSTVDEGAYFEFEDFLTAPGCGKHVAEFLCTVTIQKSRILLQKYG